MRVCSITEGNRSTAPLVVGLSTFDGVHRAHRAMVAELRRLAKERDAEVGALVVDGGTHYRARMLTSLEHRLELLEATGDIDTAWVIPETVHEHPDVVVGEALDAVRPAVLGVSGLLRLGRAEVLSLDEIAAACRQRNVELWPLDHVLPGREDAAERLYTTRNISDLLFDGHVAVAARLLGRLFEMRGEVVHGDHRGATIGVPTANLNVYSTLLIPQEGVYAGVAVLEDGSAYPAAISLGRRSTFYEDGWELLEAHLLGFDGDLYGSRLRVLFTEHLRKQVRFNGVDELVGQLRIDIALVHELDPLARYDISLAW
jgi:riboflavin kinase/FMN adenylyltransferase